MTRTVEEAVRQLQAERNNPPETDLEVMAMVRAQLERDPPPPLAALYGRAVRINPEIRKLTPRQFNARYPLQVRKQQTLREQGNGRAVSRNLEGAGRGKRPAQSERRTRIRKILLEYGKAVAAAETMDELIDVIGAVDRYVDRLFAAFNSAPVRDSIRPS